MNLLHRIHTCDLLIFNHLRRNPKTLLTLLSRYWSKTGDGFAYPFIGIALWLITGRVDAIWVSATAFLIERIIYVALKHSLKRARPADAITGYQSVIRPSDQFSFPSGHTSGAFLMATIMSYYLPPLTFIVYPWAVGVGVSRVVLGVHFPTDTLAGMALGCSIAIVSLSTL